MGKCGITGNFHSFYMVEVHCRPSSEHLPHTLYITWSVTPCDDNPCLRKHPHSDLRLSNVTNSVVLTLHTKFAPLVETVV